MIGALTTHVLDTAQGRPGAGIRVELFDVSDGRRPVTSVRTNQDGRCDAPLLGGDVFHTGQWELCARRSWTGSRSASASPPTPTTTCRCWWRREATPPTAAVDLGIALFGAVSVVR